MRSLYEIDSTIMSLVDLETGEILDYDAFVELKMEREQKIENMALWYKDLVAEATAIKAEEANLATRRKACENKAERLKAYLSDLLAGDKFKTPRVACSFRASKALQIPDEEAFIQNMLEQQHYEYLSYKKPTVNRTEITNAIKAGKVVEGAELVEKQNISIK